MGKVYCRACSVYLDVTGGCAICAPAKANLVWEESDRLTTDELCQQAARKLSVAIESVDAAKKRPDFLPLVEATKALTGLIGEMRKMDEAEASAARRMSFDEQVSAFRTYVGQLPETRRQELAYAFQEAALNRKSLAV